MTKKKYNSRRKLFTDVFCDSAPRGTHTDLGCRGLRLSVSKYGLKAFYHQFQVRGQGDAGKRLAQVRGAVKKVAIGYYPGTSLAQARAVVNAQRIDVINGIDPRSSTPFPAPNGTEPSGKTFKDVAVQYNDANETKTAAYRWRVLRDYVLPPLGHLPFAEIKRIDLGEALDKMKTKADADGAPSRIVRQQKAIKAVFKFGIKRGWREDNPTTGLDWAPKSVPDDRELTVKELRKLWAAATDLGHGPAFRFLMVTGQRRTEASLAKWSDIDLAKGVWHIPAANRKKVSSKMTDHEVYLPALALEILAKQTRDGEYVFSCNGGKSPVAGWSRFKTRMDKATGVPDWKTHHLRHTAISGMASLGVTPHIISMIVSHNLGATVSKTTQGYLHADFEAERREALERWAQVVCPSPTAPGEVVSLDEARRKA